MICLMIIYDIVVSKMEMGIIFMFMMLSYVRLRVFIEN